MKTITPTAAWDVQVVISLKSRQTAQAIAILPIPEMYATTSLFLFHVKTQAWAVNVAAIEGGKFSVTIHEAYSLRECAEYIAQGLASIDMGRNPALRVVRTLIQQSKHQVGSFLEEQDA